MMGKGIRDIVAYSKQDKKGSRGGRGGGRGGKKEGYHDDKNFNIRRWQTRTECQYEVMFRGK